MALIRTTYSGPTDTRGARIAARFVDGEHKGRQCTMPYDYSAGDPHEVAALRLIRRTNDRQGWTYADDSTFLQGETERGRIFATHAPLMPAWVGAPVD